MSSNKKGNEYTDTNKQLAESTLSSINDASTAGRALYTGFMALTAYIIVALGTTDDLQFFDRAPLTLPLLNVEISLSGFYRYTPWLYFIVHANLLLVFSIIAEKHRYFAVLLDNCAWPDRLHMRQQLHVNAFTQFLGADHKGLLALILMLMIWFTIGIMPVLLLLGIQLDFLSAQIESVTNWQQLAVLVDCLLVGYFWNNILQKKRRARFPKDLRRPFWKRYLLDGWVLWVSVLFIIGFSWLVALVPLSDYERRVHNYMPEWIELAESDCVFDEDLTSLNDLILSKQESDSELELETLKKLENDFNIQLINAAKDARRWKVPYQCSNVLTWWFIDRSDSWLNKRLKIHRWLNLPDKVFVENRSTVQPQWLNRLMSELGDNTTDAKAKMPSSVENTANTSDTDRLAHFKTLDYFLPVNMENRHLHFARFTRSFLPKAKMIKAELQGADFKEAKLQGADLSEADLQGANFSMADLQNANFSMADLQGANLKWAKLQHADLSKANLKNADLFGAELRGTTLEGTKLQKADLQLVKLNNVNLSGFELKGANFSKAELQGANLSQARLQGASLSETKLRHANLNRAQLQSADLSEAYLESADLSEARLQGADLSGAQLQGALLINLSLVGVQFSEASLDNALILNPMINWRKIEEKLLSDLGIDSSRALNEQSKENLLAAIKRMENAKSNPLPNISEATLEKQDHPCLLLTDNKELKNSAKHVCDSASDSSIDPLIHLRKWAEYNSLSSCNHKRFSTFSTRLFNIDIDIDIEYNIVNNYRIQGNNDTTPDETSEALYNLASFLLHKQLIQIHQDKTILCEGRKELNVWYKEIGYENDSEEKNRILNLKLEPFPTSMKH